MCNKPVDIYPTAINSLLTNIRQEKCVLRLLILDPFHLVLFLINIKLKNMCGKAASKDPFMMKYCFDRYG